MQPRALFPYMFQVKQKCILYHFFNHSNNVPAPHSRAIDDSIWVEHGDDLKDEGLPETLGHQVIAAQKLQSALHHPAGIGLTRMHTAGQYNIGAIT